MTSEPVEVECYSGGRSDERPRSVTIEGRRHLVARLLSESLEEPDTQAGHRERKRCYRVQTEEGLVLELVRNQDGSWSGSFF